MVNKTLDVVKAIFTIVYAASAEMFSFLQIHGCALRLSDLGDEGLCPWNEAFTAHTEFSGGADDAWSGERPGVGGLDPRRGMLPMICPQFSQESLGSEGSNLIFSFVKRGKPA